MADGPVVPLRTHRMLAAFGRVLVHDRRVAFQKARALNAATLQLVGRRGRR